MSGHPTRHTDSLLRKAVQHHKAGQTERAARFYREILRIDPDHGDAAHLLGRIAHQDGRPQTAAALFTAAARGNVTVAPYHLALGLAQWDSGHPRAAAASARRTLALCPTDPDALCLLGAAAGRLGDRRTALRSFRAAVRLAPDLPEARIGLGRVWERVGRSSTALDCYRTATRLRGADADGWMALADAFHRLNHPVEAVASYQEALKRGMDRVKAWVNLGSAWHAMGAVTRAQEAYAQALRRDPSHSDALNNLGLLRLGLGLEATARRPLVVALAVVPQHGTALVNLGVAEAAAGRFEAAAVWHRRALALNRNQPEAWNNLGVARNEQGQAATECWKRALTLNPAFADALGNLGVEAINRQQPVDAVRLLRRAVHLMPEHAPLRAACARALFGAGRMLDAARQCRQSLALVPSLTDPRWTLAAIEARLGWSGPARGLTGAESVPPPSFSRGLLALDRAVLDAGWSDCVRHPDHGHSVPATGVPTETTIPEWHGETLAGKRLLISCPEDPWETFAVAACWSDAIALAERVEIRCAPSMVGLFARSFPRAMIQSVAGAESVAQPETPTVQIAATALAHRLRDRVGRLPARSSWLCADAGRMAEWRERLDRLGGGLRVGLIQPGQGVSLLDWEPVVRLPGLTVLDLGDAGAMDGRAVPDWAAPLADDWRGDVEEAAALLACLDLVIAPSQSLAELAVALGVPVWCYGVTTQSGTSPLPVGLTRRAIHSAPGGSLASVVPRIAGDLRRLSRLNRAGDAALAVRKATPRRLN